MLFIALYVYFFGKTQDTRPPLIDFTVNWFLSDRSSGSRFCVSSLRCCTLLLYVAWAGCHRMGRRRR